MPRLAIYPGSFDPLTNGHLSLIQRGLKIFDGLVVAVANNASKKALFTLEERKQLIREVVGNDPRVEVDHFETLLELRRGRDRARAPQRGRGASPEIPAPVGRDGLRAPRSRPFPTGARVGILRGPVTGPKPTSRRFRG
jgi:cytidyltransferase-like protein